MLDRSSAREKMEKYTHSPLSGGDVRTYFTKKISLLEDAHISDEEEMTEKIDADPDRAWYSALAKKIDRETRKILGEPSEAEKKKTGGKGEKKTSVLKIEDNTTPSSVSKYGAVIALSSESPGHILVPSSLQASISPAFTILHRYGVFHRVFIVHETERFIFADCSTRARAERCHLNQFAKLASHVSVAFATQAPL
jgi:hypothetical protein